MYSIKKISQDNLSNARKPKAWTATSAALVLLLLAGTLASDAHAAGGGKKKGAVETPYVAQSQLVTTIMRSFRVLGSMQIDMGLVIKDTEQRTRATALLPVLRDGWRRTAQEYTNTFYIPNRVPDAALLGQKLQATTDQVLGRGVAKVAVEAVVVR